MSGDRFYRVNPANSADIDPQPYYLGQRVTRWDGSGPFTVVGPVPEWDLYLAVQDSSTIPQYHDRGADVLTFSGTIGQANGRVTEERQFTPWDINRLYDAKESEIGAQDYEIRYGVADSTLSANWWLIVSEAARHELAEIAAWLERPTNNYPGDASENRPRFGVYNANNGRIRREQMTEAQYTTSVQDIATHGQLTGDATHASGEALDALKAAYDADPSAANWQAVADHDAADLAWGYPSTPAGASLL